MSSSWPDLVDSMNATLDDGPFSVFYVIVKADVIERVGQVDHVRRVNPGFQFHRTLLIVKRVEDHVQSARDGIDATRLPAGQAVVVNCDQKSSVVIVIEQLVGAALITPCPMPMCMKITIMQPYSPI